MTCSKTFHRKLAILACWALASSFSLAACNEEEESPGEDDCALTDSCDQENPGDESGTSGGGGDDKPGETSQWPEINTMEYLSLYNFIPSGAFAIKTASGDKARFVAKSKDGSLITADIEWDESSEDHRTVSNWKIWHDDMYYWVMHDLIGDEVKSDRFYTLSLKYPGSSVTAPKMMRMESPWGGYAYGQVGDAAGSVLLFYYNFAAFVNDGAKDEAVFEKDDVVAGIPCKKYSHSSDFFGYVTKDEWWILDNGFCIKRNLWLNGELEGVQSFELVLAEMEPESYDAVTQKYARFRNQIEPEIPPVAGMLKATEGVAGGEWIGPDGFLEWTAGGIDFMVNFRALEWEGYPVHQVHVQFKAGTDLAEATEAYKAEIMKIPYMAPDFIGTGCMEFEGCNYSCQWPYHNDNNRPDGIGYTEYEIQTSGDSDPACEESNSQLNITPSTPLRIFIQYIDEIVV